MTGPAIGRISGQVGLQDSVKAGRHIIVMSGGHLATSLLRAGVIDEIGFNVHPVLLGAGTPAFLDPGLRVELELAECRASDGGCVFVNYRSNN